MFGSVCLSVCLSTRLSSLPCFNLFQCTVLSLIKAPTPIKAPPTVWRNQKLFNFTKMDIISLIMVLFSTRNHRLKAENVSYHTKAMSQHPVCLLYGMNFWSILCHTGQSWRYEDYVPFNFQMSIEKGLMLSMSHYSFATWRHEISLYCPMPPQDIGPQN